MKAVIRRESARHGAVCAALLAASALVVAAFQPATASAAPSCTLAAYPDPLSDLGNHSLELWFTCPPEGDEGWNYRRVRITANRTVRTFVAGEQMALHCSQSDTVVDCPVGADRSLRAQARIQFKSPVTCGGAGGLSLSAQTTAVQYDLNGPLGEYTLPMRVKGPCVGNITLKRIPKKCASRSFRVAVKVPAALRRLIAESEGLDEDQEPEERLVDDLLRRRGGKSPKTVKTLPEHSLRDFTVKVPASALSTGKYALRVALETNQVNPDDYPTVTASFKRC